MVLSRYIVTDRKFNVKRRPPLPIGNFLRKNIKQI